MEYLHQAKKYLQKQPQSRKGAAIIALGVLVWYSLKKKSPKTLSSSSSSSSSSRSSQPTNGFLIGLIRYFVPQIGSDLRERPVKFDKDFLARFHYILQTCFPSIWCRETLLLGVLTSALCARTYLTIVISEVIAESVRNFVERDFENGKWKVFSFQLLSVVAALVNAGLKYATTMLAALIRDRLTKKAHDVYLEDMNYYKVNFVGTKTLENADQLISEDIELLSSQFATIYTNLLKPIVDLIIFTIKLASTMEITGPLGMYAYFGFASLVSAVVLPPYAKLHAVMQEKEGRLREYEKRLINNAEMVAFMGGEAPEKKILDGAFESIFSQVMYVARRKLFADVIMGYVNKYAASSVGFLLLVLPYYLGKKEAVSSADMTARYVKCAQLMEGLADAVLRLFEVQKEVGQLSGLTSRVYNLFYTMLNPEKLPIPISSEYPPERKSSDSLAFRNVTVYKPDGRILVKNLTLDIPPGQRVIITGENGCGKSSLFRVLRKLWPLAEGTILQPDRIDSFYFLSQVNFVPIGSLREIIIYPHSVEEMKQRGKTDEDLRELLRYTRLEDLELNDEKPTFDSVWDWNTALSPGQKQRMAFARLFYHRPQYAVLDECTNGVAPNVENELYNRCTELGITVFSISHKLELKELHDYELHYLSDGKGGFEFLPIDKSGSRASPFAGTPQRELEKEA